MGWLTAGLRRDADGRRRPNRRHHQCPGLRRSRACASRSQHLSHQRCVAGKRRRWDTGRPAEQLRHGTLRRRAIPPTRIARRFGLLGISEPDDMKPTAATLHGLNRVAATRLSHQSGLSLVELMVGLSIGLLLTVGLVGMIAGTSRSFAVQDDFARVQENGSMALNQLGDDIRMAGFYGAATTTTAIDPTKGSAITTVDDCGPANWALDTARPIHGRADLVPGTVNGVFPCIASNNFQAGQVLVIRRAAGYLIPDPNSDGNLTDAVSAQPNFSTTI